MKMKVLELGDAKDKPDDILLHDKTRSRFIVLKYSFEELEHLLEKEKPRKRE